MLILDVKTIDAIKIGDNIIISFHVKNGKAKIGISAPRELGIDRISAEDWEEITGKNFHYYLPDNRKDRG